MMLWCCYDLKWWYVWRYILEWMFHHFCGSVLMNWRHWAAASRDLAFTIRFRSGKAAWPLAQGLWGVFHALGFSWICTFVIMVHTCSSIKCPQYFGGGSVSLLARRCGKTTVVEKSHGWRRGAGQTTRIRSNKQGSDHVVLWLLKLYGRM